MDICCCEKCNKWFDVNDEYDVILVAKKIGEGYEVQHFCQECGKQMHDAIKSMLKESEGTGDE